MKTKMEAHMAFKKGRSYVCPQNAMYPTFNSAFKPFVFINLRHKMVRDEIREGQ